MLYDQNTLDSITLVSFLIGMANYYENLEQSQKDDVIREINRQTHDMLFKVHKSLYEQNTMLREILRRLEK